MDAPDLSKNPVNLSVFIEFYRNSVFSNKPIGSTIIPESPESARTANAGKCGPGESLDPGEEWLSGTRKGRNDSVADRPPRLSEGLRACPEKGRSHRDGCIHGRRRLQRRQPLPAHGPARRLTVCNHRKQYSDIATTKHRPGTRWVREACIPTREMRHAEWICGSIRNPCA